MKAETTLFLVDDHAVIRKGLRLLLEAEEGYRVVGEAGDGEEAIKGARETKPDLVVMDITLPGLNGVEATKAILSEVPGTRVLALSVHSTRSFVRDMLDAGASGYILKQSAPEELVAGINRVMDGEVFLGGGIQDLVVADYLSGLSERREPAPTPSPVPILTTRLHRPPVSSELQARPRLMDLMSRSLQLPLALISAPAGYGKSTLASSWLEQCEHPVLWISLDKDGDDLRSFLSYLGTAVQGGFPGIGKETLGLAGMPELPSISNLVRQLLMDLDQIDRPFVLVLDDLHQIQDPDVMELIAGILRDPPTHLHLILLTRWDPALPLSNLRARGQLVEITVEDLRFTQEETAGYLETILKEEVDRATVEALDQRLEGWVTGIRLAGLSVRTAQDLGRLVSGLTGDAGLIPAYLLEEVLSRLPAEHLESLLATSILDRFNASLCDAILAPKTDSGESESDGGPGRMIGAAFIDWARRSQLFLVPLDLEGAWFRYHHLFQDLLKRELERRKSADEVLDFHRRAALWFRGEKLVEEAIRHSMAAGEPEWACEIVEENRYEALNQDRWIFVERWLELVPLETKERSPNALLAEAWTLYHRMLMPEVAAAVERVHKLLGGGDDFPALRGEADHFLAWITYWQGDLQGSLDLCSRFRERMPKEEKYDVIRGDNAVYVAMNLQGLRRKREAITGLEAEVKRNVGRQGMYLNRLYGAGSFTHLLDGALSEAIRESRRCKRSALELNLNYALKWSEYFETCCLFHRNDFEQAHPLFAALVRDRHSLHGRQALSAFTGLAMAQHALGREDDAARTMVELQEYAKESKDPFALPIASSARARLALQQGDLLGAREWFETSELPSHPSLYFIWLEVPVITACRTLVTTGSAEALRESTGLLEQAIEAAEGINNIIHSIDLLAIQALAQHKQGQKRAGIETLQRAVALAAPGRVLRPFVELGTPMADLLKEVRNQGVAVTQIQEILAAFQSPAPGEAAQTPVPREAAQAPATQAPATQAPTTRAPTTLSGVADGGGEATQEISGLGQLLTEREVDVLIQLSKGHSNKAIARNLHLSTETVKKHLYNAFKKLNVNNRVAALATARELGVLPRG